MDVKSRHANLISALSCAGKAVDSLVRALVTSEREDTALSRLHGITASNYLDDSQTFLRRWISTQ